MMLKYLSLTGLLLSGILLYIKALKFRSTLYLGLFFFTISLYGLNQYVLLYSNSVFLVAVIITNFTFIFYLTGPMMYWYIRSILTDNSRLRKSDFIHLLPMLIYLASALPYMLTPWSYKTEIAAAIIRDIGFAGTFKFTVLSEIFSNTVVYLSRPVVVLGYALWCVGLFIRYIRQHKNRRVLSGQFFMIKWLAVFLGFVLILIVSHLISIFLSFAQASDVFFTTNVLQILSAVGMIGLLGSPFFFPGILYGLPCIPDKILRNS
ncbi:MAG: hypothetical protein WCJ95_16130 [Mariniphaga sp.]